MGQAIKPYKGKPKPKRAKVKVDKPEPATPETIKVNGVQERLFNVHGG